MQRPTVLGHGPHNVVRRTGGHICLDFQRYPHIRAHNAGKVRNNLLGNTAGITAHTSWIKCWP